MLNTNSTAEDDPADVSALGQAVERIDSGFTGLVTVLQTFPTVTKNDSVAVVIDVASPVMFTVTWTQSASDQLADTWMKADSLGGQGGPARGARLANV